MAGAGRVWAMALTLGVTGGACTPRYAIRPIQGGYVGVAESSGLVLHADPDAWRGQPEDLPDHITPIALRLINTSGKPVAVRYDKLRLTDDRGFRYPVINPYVHPGTPQPPAQQYQDVPPSVPIPEPEVPTTGPGALWRINGPDTERVSSTSSAAAHLLAYRVYRNRGGRRRVRVHRGRRGRRYYVYPNPRVRRQRHHPNFPVWAVSAAPVIIHQTHVRDWGAPGFAVRAPADVCRLGLPEGVLKSGGEVSGFVYFRPVSEQARRLQLRLDAQTPDGQNITSLQVPFVIVAL